MTKRRRKMQLALTLNRAAKRLEQDIEKGARKRIEHPNLWDGGPFSLTVHGPGYGMHFKSVQEIKDMLRKVVRS